MPRSSKTISLKGEQFLINQWGPEKVLDMAPDIAQIFVEPMMAMMGGMKDLSTPESTQSLIAAVGKFTSRLKEKRPSDFFKLVLSETVAIGSSAALGESAKFTDFFGGRPELVLPLVVETLKYQYANFLPALLEMVPQTKVPVPGA